MATESVIGGKTLRACDSCVCHRARWYCAADDAFLCQSCDSSVHSANPLARRHHRVRFQTTIKKISKCNKLAPTWHHGFKRKARTPRPSPKAKSNSGRGVSSSLVPEIETSAVDEGSNEEGEQLLYRVPTFDPVLAEFYSPTLADESNAEAKPTVQLTDHPNTISNSNSDCLLGLIQSDAELAEFAADMERLLGRGFENDSFSMEGLGLVDTKTNELVKEEFVDNNENDTIVDGVKMYQEIDLSRETLEIDFDCRSGSDEGQVTDEYEEGKTKIGLRLDYEAVSVEWSAYGCLSPWVNGERPQLGLDDCWLNSMGMWGVEEVQGVVCGGVGGVHIDEEREARVSRYREKRRTRLFSKKIRYQVRKLNAEKRPRMKGRFVKRVSL